MTILLSRLAQRNTRVYCRHLLLHKSRSYSIRVTTRYERCSVFAIVSACETQPTPTKAHVRMPSLPFELPRLLHGASVRQFPRQLVCHRASRLVGIYSHSRVRCARKQSPYPGNASAEIQKAGSIGCFHAVFDNAGSTARCFSRARQGNDLLPGDRLSREARVHSGGPA